MQSIQEIESICYQAELDRAEAYMNEHYGDPTPEEVFRSCTHADACRRALVQGRRSGGCGYSEEDESLDGGIWVPLACEECDEWDG